MQRCKDCWEKSSAGPMPVPRVEEGMEAAMPRTRVPSRVLGLCVLCSNANQKESAELRDFRAVYFHVMETPWILPRLLILGATEGTEAA